MTQQLPDDGAVIWKITAPAGVRWARIRKAGGALALPAGHTAVPATWDEVDQVVAEAGQDRYEPPWPAPGELWRLAEAAGPAWGWVLRKLPGVGGPVTGWSLVTLDPGGREYRFTWVRSGGLMRLEAQTETIRAVLDRLGGP
jgi:hypothetical protein